MTETKDYHERTDCRLCGGSLAKVLDLGETALANEYPRTSTEHQDTFPLYLAECRVCGHVQLPVVVKAERLFPADYPYKSGTTESFRKHLAEFARSTVAGMKTLRPVVLEIASNDGTLMREFQSRGCVTHGIDPCAAGVVGNERGFYSGEWARRFRARHGRVDLVVALNVFAHVDDLHDFAEGVAALLKDTGVFVFEVGYLKDVVEKGLFDVIYHEHLSYHHLRPLIQFFEQHGLELYDAERVDSQGGSIRCFVRCRQIVSERSERLKEMIRAEEGMTITSLKERIEELRSKMQEVLRDTEEKGWTISGYGAPAKLTTMMAALGIRREHLGVIYDDNPDKVGRFTPGTRVPILPSANLLTNQPERCIIFSWNFVNEILQRFPEYKGKWVIPFPDFQSAREVLS